MSAAELPVLELSGGAKVLFSSQIHGNLSSTTGEGANEAEAARQRLIHGLGLERLMRCRQVHGTTVLRDGAPDNAEADGCATNTPAVGTMVLVADCLPVALSARGAVAMLHAGWRGLAAGVLERGVDALRELGGEGPIAAAIGPGAGVCCYEVGEEVHAVFGDAQSEVFGAAHRQGRNLDLRALARERLLGAGVEDIQGVALCTICDRSLFSHRREGVRAGRQAGVAWLS
jgi:YfiH family protein